MKIVWRSRGSAVGIQLIYIISHQEVSLKEREILNCGDGLVPRRYGITGARERQREVLQQTELPLLQYSQ